MCVAGEEELSGSSASGSGSFGDIPTINVTAPRLGLDLATYDAIDWTEVLAHSTIGLVAGGLSAGLPGALIGQVAAAATGIEGQEDIDLVDLFEIKNDMILIPGAPGPYAILH